jgi:hypothetical protein
MNPNVALFTYARAWACVHDMTVYDSEGQEPQDPVQCALCTDNFCIITTY